MLSWLWKSLISTSTEGFACLVKSGTVCSQFISPAEYLFDSQPVSQMLLYILSSRNWDAKWETPTLSSTVLLLNHSVISPSSSALKNREGLTLEKSIHSFWDGCLAATEQLPAATLTWVETLLVKPFLASLSTLSGKFLTLNSARLL